MSEYTLTTPCGDIRGSENGGVYTFCGIPYADTPRFEKPIPIEHWDGVLNATPANEIDCWQHGSFCDETGDFYCKEFGYERGVHYAETPMTLSIVTPQLTGNAPVLLFIHGGGFETGTVGELPYGGSDEYARRGVVFVSVGYRLNVFSLYRSANYGLLDQAAAIEWVSRNIAAFGGDGQNITIMGQSAGAMSVTNLCYTNRLQGIVTGAVMMSGGGTIPKLVAPMTPQESKPFWDAVQQKAGAATEEEMRTLPAKTLWEAWYEVSRNPYKLRCVQPGIDGEIIPDLPQKMLRRGEGLDIPMIFGVTSQDFMPVLLYEIALRRALFNYRHRTAPAYGYMFARTLPGNRYKAFHAADLWYTFGQMDKSWRPFEEKDRALSAQMIDYIANFAKTHNPNGEGLPAWPAVTPKQKGFRLLDGESDGLIYPAACRKKMLHTQLRDKGPM